jgi:hypothetical protein
MFVLYIPASDTRGPETFECDSVRECEVLGDEIAEDKIYSVERARDRRLVLVANVTGKHRYC